MADEERTRDEVLLADVAEGSEITDIRTWKEKLLADAAAGEETRPDARERIDLFINEIDGSGGGGGGGGGNYDYMSLLPYLQTLAQMPSQDLENLVIDVLLAEDFYPLFNWFVSQGASQISPNALDSEAAILSCSVALACFFQNAKAYQKYSDIIGYMFAAESVGALYGVCEHLIAADNGFQTCFDDISITLTIAVALLAYGSFNTPV